MNSILPDAIFYCILFCSCLPSLSLKGQLQTRLIDLGVNEILRMEYGLDPIDNQDKYFHALGYRPLSFLGECINRG